VYQKRGKTHTWRTESASFLPKLRIAWKAKKQSLDSRSASAFLELENLGFQEPLKNLASFLTLKAKMQINTEFETFRENIDSWIKQIRREFTEFSDLPSMVSENTDNIQHNYELIYELKDEIEELKQEINALKLIQIISLKQKMGQKAEETQQT